MIRTVLLWLEIIVFFFVYLLKKHYFFVKNVKKQNKEISFELLFQIQILT